MCAQIAPAEAIKLTDKYFASVKVRDDGSVRSEVAVSRNAYPGVAYELALRAAAIKIKELGFKHFMIEKATGGTLQMSGIDVNHQGRVVAMPVTLSIEPAPGVRGPWLSVEEVINRPLPDRL